MGDTMKRWQLTRLGREQLERVDAPIPAPGPGEILVRVDAVALNYRDKLMIDDGMGLALGLPFTPGSDLAGEVVATGPGVTRFAAGARVISTFWTDWVDGRVSRHGAALGGPLPGVLAEYVVLGENGAVAAPASLTAVEASTLPCAGLTAWTALVEEGRLRPGDTVLVQGTGGVALFGLQIAAALGARVIVTSGSDAKLARALSLGAAHGINRSTTPDWERAVLNVTGGRGVDQVLELVGGDNLGRSVNALAEGGRVSVIGMLAGIDLSASFYSLVLRRATIQGIGVGHRRALADLVRAVDALGIRPVIDSEYAFSELPAALARLDAGPFGKVVLRLRD